MSLIKVESACCQTLKEHALSPDKRDGLLITWQDLDFLTQIIVI